MYYKDPTNKLHHLDDAAFEHLLPDGTVQITDAEAQEIIAANTPAPMVKDQIAAIESTITQRRLREAALGIDGGWLAAKEAEIAALRSHM